MTWDEIDVWLAEHGFTPDAVDVDGLDDIDLEIDDPWGTIELAPGSLTDDQRRFLVDIAASAARHDHDDDDEDDEPEDLSS